MLVELRGIALQSCLNGGGQIWDSSAGDLRYRGRAKVCRRLDYFVSHDWGTSRWVKLLTLAVHFNGMPALFASCAVSVLAFVLQVAGALTQRAPPQDRLTAGVEHVETRGVWCFPAGLCTFFFVLVYWQVCREVVLPAIYLFVDKMCINQGDSEEKQRGVYSIGGFLQKSDVMLMLCTPRYFSRTWCAFEVAAWLRLKGVGSIIFLPPSDAVLTGIFFSIVLFTHCGIYLGCQFHGVPLGPVSNCLAFFAPLPLVHAARLAMRDLLSMPELLRAHDVAETSCFCCDHQHVHPVTGSALMCDRVVVYDAVSCWYGSDRPRSSQEMIASASQTLSHEMTAAIGSGIAVFNEEVQTQLSEALEVMVARPVSYATCLISSAPSMWYFLDGLTAIALDGLGDPHLTVKRSLRIFIIGFLLWPLARASVVAMARRFRHRGTDRCGEFWRLAAAFGTGYLPIYAGFLWLVLVASPRESLAFEAVLVALLGVWLAILLRPAQVTASPTPRREVTA